jgi:hypothetical protein
MLLATNHAHEEISMQLTALPPTPPTSTPTAPVADPSEPFYGSRWERSFEMTPETADRLQALVDGVVPRETLYPNPQRIQTVYVRSSDPKRNEADKFRIRTYLDSPGPPTVLEFKDRVVEDGHEVTKKVRIPLASDATTRLLWGESGASVIGLEGRSGVDAVTAQRAINVVDKLNLRPVVKQQYVRTSFEDAKTGVRITFDRDIAFTGIGELARAGSSKRSGVIMDVKVLGKTPEWLSTVVAAELGAKHIAVVDDGKGSTAVAELRKRLDKLDAKHGVEIIVPKAA